MKALSIMQPYVFPYIGYFHLIEATDKIVFYDDVNYIKRGWINRNNILINGSEFLFTIPVEKASQNKLINEIIPIVDNVFMAKFGAQLESAYKRAPFYKPIKELNLRVLERKYENIADMAINSFIEVYHYLGKEINWTKSSICSPGSKGIDRADRLIQITKELGYESYVNAYNGQELYDKEYFKNRGIQLSFVQPNKIEYNQFGNAFVPNLSIIDVLMFNDKGAVREMLNEYRLV
jgi:hypothetical protein